MGNVHLLFFLAPLPVNITSDAGSVVCDITVITLTCSAPNATQFKWSRGEWSVQRYGDPEVTYNKTITVTATHHVKDYVCAVSDSDGNTGWRSIFVMSNGMSNNLHVVT